MKIVYHESTLSIHSITLPVCTSASHKLINFINSTAYLLILHCGSLSFLAALFCQIRVISSCGLLYLNLPCVSRTITLRLISHTLTSHQHAQLNSAQPCHPPSPHHPPTAPPQPRTILIALCPYNKSFTYSTLLVCVCVLVHQLTIVTNTGMFLPPVSQEYLLANDFITLQRWSQGIRFLKEVIVYHVS